MTRRVALLVITLIAMWSPFAEAQDQIEYYATDAVGSVRVVFDQAGAVKARAEFLPFGGEISAAASMPPERFTGQTRDGESGLETTFTFGCYNRVLAGLP